MWVEYENGKIRLRAADKCDVVRLMTMRGYLNLDGVGQANIIVNKESEDFILELTLSVNQESVNDCTK